MNRQREIRPWGFSAYAWQGTTFALASLLALTNAAWFYSMRVAKVEAAAATRQAPTQPVERVIYQTADGRVVDRPSAYPAPAPSPARERVQARPLASDEQCIGGTRFRVSGSTWTQTGTC